MANGLDIRVVDLKRAVVRADVQRVLREEKGMVVHPLLFPVDVHKARDASAVGRGEDVRRFEVEVLCVEVVGPLKVADKAGWWLAEPFFHTTGTCTHSPKWPSL